MVHFMNVFASVLTFVVSLGTLYAFWTPATAFISALGTELQILCYSGLALISIMSLIALPISMLISND